MNESQAKILIIVVHHDEAVLPLLQSLKQLRRCEEAEIVVSDDASSEEHLSHLRSVIQSFSGVKLIESRMNRGYLGAARFALDQLYSAGRRLPEWIIVSNSDVLIEDPAFLEKLFAIDPDCVGMIAPKIIAASSNLNQNPFMKHRPGWARRFRMRIHSHDYFLCVAWDWLSRAKQTFKSKIAPVPSGALTGSETARVSIYAPHGSFMIFSRKYFEGGGYLDDQLFLNAEEITVGEICRRLDLPVIYDPSLSLLHNEHQSVGLGITRAKFRYHRRSVRYVLSEYLTPESAPITARQRGTEPEGKRSGLQ